MKSLFSALLLLFVSYSSYSQYHKIDPIINSGQVIINRNVENAKIAGHLLLYYFEKYAIVKDDFIKVSFLSRSNSVLYTIEIAKVYQHNYIDIDVSSFINNGDYYHVLIENMNNRTSQKLKVKCENY